MLQWSQLEDSNRNVRNAALETLAKLEPSRLAQYAGAVVARLEDSHWSVRKLALETLGKLEPATLAQYAGAVVARLEDSHWERRPRSLRAACGSACQLSFGSASSPLTLMLPPCALR